MAAHPRAGQRAQPEDLIDVAQVVTAYYTIQPDPDNVDQQVAFGTSGHRGSSLDAAFNEAHILATTQAIVEYRAAQGTTGPLFIGRDTHALSEPAWASALEVLAANDVVAMIDSADRYTPTPAVSHAILTFNRGRDGDLADGIVVTPSHNPPRDGGFKYNPPNGGPADTDATGVIAKRANEILRDGLQGGEAGAAGPRAADRAALRLHGRLRRRPAERRRCARHPRRGHPHRRRSAGRGECRLLGCDRRASPPEPDRGQPAGRRDVSIHDAGHRRQDPDGLQLTQRDGVADRQPRQVPDRHRQRRRLRPARHRHPRRRADQPEPLPGGGDRLPVQPPARWPGSTAVGKTAVSSSIIDRVVAGLGRKLVEVPVGFKWFVDGLLSGTIGFGGEESAGASFLRRDGTVWTTDKDGIMLALLASEILAVTG